MAADSTLYSRAKSVGFRPGQARRQWFDDLKTELGIGPSDVCRTAIETFAPQVEAILRAQGKAPTPADCDEIRDLLEALEEIRGLGLDPRDLLKEALRLALIEDAKRLAQEPLPEDLAATG